MLILKENSKRKEWKTFLVAPVRGYILLQLQFFQCEFQNGFFNCVLRYQTGNVHFSKQLPKVINQTIGEVLPCLTQPMTSILRLFIVIRIQVNVVNYYIVRRSQIDSQSAGFRRK